MAAVAVSGLMLVEFVRAFTFSVAVLLVAPGPLSAEVIAPVVLFFEPVVVPVTLSEIVHEPLAASVPTDKLIEPDPAVAVVVPLHVLLRLLGFATTSPAGKLSVNATPLRLVVFGLLIVNVRLVLALSGIEPAPNAFEIVGGVATVMLAEAVFPVATPDRKSTRLNSSHVRISYAVFCLKKKKRTRDQLLDPELD